jgi:hypothetical protein
MLSIEKVLFSVDISLHERYNNSHCNNDDCEWNGSIIEKRIYIYHRRCIATSNEMVIYAYTIQRSTLVVNIAASSATKIAKKYAAETLTQNPAKKRANARRCILFSILYRRDYDISLSRQEAN